MTGENPADLRKRIKTLEKALAASEARFQGLVMSNADAILVSDHNGILRFVNPAALRLFQRTEEELLGCVFGFPFVSGDKEEIEIFRPGHGIAIAEMRVVPIEWEGGSAFLATLRDITERKLTEEALRTSEETLRIIFNSVSEAIFIFGLDGVVMNVNDKALQLFSISRERAQSLSVADFLGTPESPLDDLARIWCGVVAGESHDFTCRARKLSGEPQEMSLDIRLGRCILDEQEVVLGTARDVTERTRFLQALEQQAAELARSNEELERFAYIASHDLQEPLRNIVSFAQLIQRRYMGQLDEDADVYINFLVDGANRMSQLISDLLEFSRVGIKGRPFQETDCAQVLGMVLRNLDSTIRENGASVIVNDLPVVLADESQLLQLFQNLLANAIKFRSSEPPMVNICCSQEKDYWLFAVSDNGIGIAPDSQERIFQVFQRLHTVDRYAGSGIGLAICKRIVERHNGRIWVTSEEGRGSTFFFTLPVNHEDSHATN